MNIFILNTGRCGSTTFIEACQYISNYSASHESRSNIMRVNPASDNSVSDNHFAYPENHIEADNRLSWLLGRLDSCYGNSAFYVHLKRDKTQTALSFEKRKTFGILKAYREGILMGASADTSDHELALDYINTVELNIDYFLKDKTRKLTINLETIIADFKLFWGKIGASGNLELALKIWNTRYNAS